MKLAKPLTLALALAPALVQAHPGHPGLPGHEHAAGFLDSPALGFVAGLVVVVALIVVRITAAKRR